jgi:hypothetical protein
VTKAANAEGVSASLARADHKHDVSTAAPVVTGSANAEGSSTALARADHVHETAFYSFLVGAEESQQHRQEFTLCAGNNNTASDSPSTLGATRIDPALLPAGSHITGALKWQVIYSVTPGRTANITLRDHTNSVNIHTFSAQASTVPAYLEATVSVPASPRIYVVNVSLDQLGAGGERATLHMSLLEHTWVRN